MKSFWIKIGLVLLPFVVFIVVVEVSLQNEPQLYFEKSEYLKNHGDDIEILFMGNSTMGSAVIPDLVHPKSYNLALPVEHPTRSLELALHLAPQLPNLKKVVLGLNYVSLLTKDHVEHLHSIHYRRNFGTPTDSFIENSIVSITDRPERILFLLIQVYPFLDFYENNENPMISRGKGHFFTPRVNVDTLKTLQNRHTAFNRLVDITNQEPNIRRVSQLVAALNDLQIEVVFIRIPTSKLDTQYQNKEYEIIHEVLIEKITAHCEACSYYDLSKEENLTHEYLYSDTFHANIDGAIQISKFVRAIIEWNEN